MATSNSAVTVRHTAGIHRRARRAPQRTVKPVAQLPSGEIRSQAHKKRQRSEQHAIQREAGRVHHPRRKPGKIEPASASVAAVGENDQPQRARAEEPPPGHGRLVMRRVGFTNLRQLRCGYRRVVLRTVAKTEPPNRRPVNPASASTRKAARHPKKCTRGTISTGASAPPSRLAAHTRPWQRARSRAGNQRAITPAMLGYAPAAPSPKKNRDAHNCQNPRDHEAEHVEAGPPGDDARHLAALPAAVAHGARRHFEDPVGQHVGAQDPSPLLRLDMQIGLNRGSRDGNRKAIEKCEC